MADLNKKKKIKYAVQSTTFYCVKYCITQINIYVIDIVWNYFKFLKYPIHHAIYTKCAISRHKKNTFI